MSQLSPPLQTKSLPYLQKTVGSSQLIVDVPMLFTFKMKKGKNLNTNWPGSREYKHRPCLCILGTDRADGGPICFDDLDKGIVDARKHGLRLILLWFGSYKNALSSYVPPWVRQDVQRFPRMHLRQPDGSLKTQPYNEELKVADSKAFAALMAHLKEINSEFNTVIMVQVENEVGLLFESRDGSSKATELYNSPVPKDFLNHLKEKYNSLHPAFQNKSPKVNFEGNESLPLTWVEAFGGGAFAEDTFLADAFSRFCQRVASAGRAEYNIPIFMNVAICSESKDWADSIPVPDYVPEGDVPGQFPSGGPVGHNMEIYRYNAPDIDFYAPDIYLQNYGKVCDCFHDGKQPLFIPEQRRDDFGARRIWSAYGNHQAIGCSPFGIDSLGLKSSAWPLHYKLLGNISSCILEAQANCPDDIFGFYFDELNESKKDIGWNKTMGSFKVSIERAFVFGKPDTGAGMVIWLDGDEFLVAGYGFQVVFESTNPKSTFTGILRADEVEADGNGWFYRVRTLNGDETQHSKFSTMPSTDSDYDGFPIPTLSPAGTMLAKCVAYSLEETAEDF